MNVKAGKTESRASVRTLDEPGGLRRRGQGAGHCGFCSFIAEVQSCVTVEISLRGGEKRKKKIPGTEVFASFLSMG